jgi:hypothetical protein
MFYTAEERTGITKLVVACRDYPGKTSRREQERVTFHGGYAHRGPSETDEDVVITTFKLISA